MESRHVLVVLALATSCAPALKMNSDAQRPSSLGSRCGLSEKGSAPLIVDWTSGDRARLEARIKQGVIAANVSDCSIRPLWDCRVDKSYVYGATTRRTESERISDAKSLFARLPTTAVSLEGKLSTQNEIRVDKTTVGRFAFNGQQLSEPDLKGSCSGATHVISGIVMGAFRLVVGERNEAGGSAQVLGAGSGAQVSKERELLSTDGDVAACANATEASPTPPMDCAAPIQLELSAVARSLDADTLRAALAKGSLEVNEVCRKHGQFGGGAPAIMVVFEPSGRVATSWPAERAGGFFGTSAYACALEVWDRQRVPPFDGPPVGAEALFFIDDHPPRDCNGAPGCSDRREHVKVYYRQTSPALILTEQDAKRFDYKGPLPGK